jgi:hypothetical protein
MVARMEIVTHPQGDNCQKKMSTGVSHPRSSRLALAGMHARNEPYRCAQLENGGNTTIDVASETKRLDLSYLVDVGTPRGLDICAPVHFAF